MRHLVPLCTLVLLASLSLHEAAGQEEKIVIPRKHHAWASFSPGAWKCVRVVTETFDSDGNVASTGVTETTTVLKKITADKVTLEVSSSVWVAGSRLERKPQAVTQGLYGQADGHKVVIKDQEPSELTIEGKKIPCRVRQLTITSPDGKHVQKVTLHFNDDVSPYILRRYVVMSDGKKNTTDDTTTVEVNALRMLYYLPDGIKTAAHVRTIHKHANGGTTLTLAYTSSDMPGGILGHWSKQVDKEGRLVRRSVLYLTGYGLEPPAEEETRPGLLPRRPRPPRLRRGLRASTEEEHTSGVNRHWSDRDRARLSKISPGLSGA